MHPWDAYIWVADLSALHQEFQAKGASIIRGPESTFYETRKFEMKDCNGHVLCLGQDIST
jgi:predicted enzyme related to lactoylglutathione lyase